MAVNTRHLVEYLARFGGALSTTDSAPITDILTQATQAFARTTSDSVAATDSLARVGSQINSGQWGMVLIHA